MFSSASQLLLVPRRNLSFVFVLFVLKDSLSPHILQSQTLSSTLFMTSFEDALFLSAYPQGRSQP